MVSMLMKWLIELSRTSFQDYLRQKHTEIERGSVFLAIKQPEISSDLNSRSSNTSYIRSEV